MIIKTMGQSEQNYNQMISIRTEVLDNVNVCYIFIEFFLCMYNETSSSMNIFFWIDRGESIGGVSMFKFFIKVSLENNFYFQKRTLKLFLMKCCNILQDFICFKKSIVVVLMQLFDWRENDWFFFFYWKCKNAQNLISKLLSLGEYYPISRPTNKRDR